jgi:hypothetical protein
MENSTAETVEKREIICWLLGKSVPFPIFRLPALFFFVVLKWG